MRWICVAILAIIGRVAGAKQQERTLAFVFDITFSMVADLEHLKFGIQEIFKGVTTNLDSRYSHYLFLGFHDPVIGLPFVTDNRTELVEAIKGLYAFPLSLNNDCEEQCLPALYHALYSVHDQSDVLVFTDDNSKGHESMPLIMDLVDLIKPKISFIITPGCNFGNLDENYETLAAVTGGQIYEIVKRNVSALVSGLSAQLRTDWTLMLNKQFNVGGTHDIELQIEQQGQLLISLTGHNVGIRVWAPGNKDVTSSSNFTINMQNAKELIVDRPVSGVWKLEVTGAAKHRLRVLGMGNRGLGKSLLGIFGAYCAAFGMIIAFCLWQYKWFWAKCKDLWWKMKRPDFWCCCRSKTEG